MEKSLNEMRSDIGKKDQYEADLAALAQRWDAFEPETRDIEKLYEQLDFYQNNSQKSTEEIIKLTNLLKNKIKKIKGKIDGGRL